MTEIGSRQWNDSAEMSEWAFMAMVMREAKDLLPMNFSPLGVAIDIADARAKSGWRTVPDDDFAPDQTAEIARLQAIQEAAEIERLRGVLRGISERKISDEWTKLEWDVVDPFGQYDDCINTARAALKGGDA